MANSHSPLWLSDDRKAHLVKLFSDSQGFCVFGDRPCPIPEHHYQLFIEDLIADWVADDKAQRQADWDAERKQLHSFGERLEPLRGQFSSIAKEVYFSNQPTFYLVGVGVSGVTFKPFAKVRLSSGFVNLYIDLDLTDRLKGLSKSQRRKALRYGKVTDHIRAIITEAVNHYHSH